MFQTGQEVACVIDGWPDDFGPSLIHPTPAFELTKGAVYRVQAVYPVGFRGVAGVPLIVPCIGIGKCFETLRAEISLQDLPKWSTYDLWPVEWFRRLQRNAESVEQAMTIFRKMTETTKTPEVIGA